MVVRYDNTYTRVASPNAHEMDDNYILLGTFLLRECDLDECASTLSYWRIVSSYRRQFRIHVVSLSLAIILCVTPTGRYSPLP